ncbi:hypothetical protein [Streptomyces sp. NBC_00057]|uniref:hypothetical protein n=1 Tax=Streptomyces sp. NBC_00057 TaxID=2975634 RepID=UPI0032499657
MPAASGFVLLARGLVGSDAATRANTPPQPLRQQMHSRVGFTRLAQPGAGSCSAPAGNLHQYPTHMANVGMLDVGVRALVQRCVRVDLQR